MTTVTNYRNAQYNTGTLIDLEILTDEFGWIPTTVDTSDNDEELHVIQIKAWLVTNANQIAAYVPPVVVPQYKTQFSSNDFLDKFTQAEQETIATATASNVQIKLYYDRLLAADYIDVEDVRTIGGLNVLSSLGLISVNRKGVVLTPELIV